MPANHDPCTRAVTWPCREAERAQAAEALAGPTADAGTPKAKPAKRDPSQPRKIGPVHVCVIDHVPARRASGDDACVALACIRIPCWMDQSRCLQQLAHDAMSASPIMPGHFPVAPCACAAAQDKILPCVQAGGRVYPLLACQRSADT